MTSAHVPLSSAILVSYFFLSVSRRLSRLEGQYVMQSQMIGLQTSLDRILAAVTHPGAPVVIPPEPPIYPQTVREGLGYVTNVSGARSGLDPQYDPALMQDQRRRPQRTFPPRRGK
ncbi:hypothetical protein V8E52_006044 [Russula decolorans]